MRLIFGMILGFLVTLGGAYVADNMVSKSPPDSKPMVNWDVVSKNAGDLAAKIKEQWNKLVG